MTTVSRINSTVQIEEVSSDNRHMTRGNTVMILQVIMDRLGSEQYADQHLQLLQVLAAVRAILVI